VSPGNKPSKRLASFAREREAALKARMVTPARAPKETGRMSNGKEKQHSTAKAAAASSKLKAELERTKKTAREHETNLKNTTIDRDKLKSANETLVDEVAKAKAEAGRLRKARDEHRMKCEDLKKTNTTLEQQLSDLVKGHKKLKEQLAQMGETEGDTSLGQRVVELQSALDAATKNKDDCMNRLNLLKTNFESTRKKYKHLEEKNKELTDQIQQCLGELKEQGKASASEQSDDIKRTMKKWIRGDGYREWKFLNSDQAVKQFVAGCHADLLRNIPTIGDKHEPDYVSKQEIHRIYTQWCIKCLNERRQYSQSQMIVAVTCECTHLIKPFCQLKFA
jgi:DNA repair exonuclease SbcCD ATPase subunit